MRPKTLKSFQVFALMSSLILALLPTASLGQEVRGTITGRVVDSNKAVIHGALVKITNVKMGTTVSVTTNDAGVFAAPYLVPGGYQVSVEVKGFKKYVQQGIEVRIGETLDLPISLETGGTEEAITITADAQQLETATASMGQTVDNRRVGELPLVHGEPYTLMGLSPGTNFARDPRLDRPFEPTHIVG
jgi:hypothetical protein